MRRARVSVDGVWAGELQELIPNKHYRYIYLDHYKGPAVSLEMPANQLVYDFDRFPPFFEGLLPEGMMLEGLLRRAKLDRQDYMNQLITVGHDLVGNVTVEAIE